MATICRTADGDCLDSLCQYHYGHLLGSVEAVLEANPGLTDEPQPLRAGLLIRLPELPPPSDPRVRLWD
ncbi:phage tail protein [Pseudomonas citronellolis]|uniref:Phage tail protein n=1 Tax=Pseudomonas citronellolis TaxID=53408 RepID=A0A1A9K7L8_9PSED|nr:tail protein X [Pseudomonas citronellolis]ANI13100.1 phage tail protein [Pseudomonas citronellolis]